MFDLNPLLNTDSYKLSHWLQYPPETQEVSSYVESRGGPFANILFFGLQAFLIDYLGKPIARADIDDAEEVARAHGLPFHRAGWLDLVARHGGVLPVEISAIPEGTVLAPQNVLAQIRNTDPAFYWLTSYLETAFLRAIWYPTTVATVSHACKQVIRRALEETSDDPEGQLPFKLHDFGARGVSSLESAMLGGMAHLVNFRGTDTLAALPAARRYYDEPMAGFSIPAAEHSTITAWGRDNEAAAYANMLEKFGKPGGLVAVVSDSYDLFNAVENIWGGVLREQVLAMGGTLVVRPDSGHPPTIVRQTVTLLADKFGAQRNGKGFFVLNPAVRVIQGDGVDVDSIGEILAELKDAGFAADNIAFGMGGALLQRLDRDTLRFAMKASAIKIGGVWRDVYKEPSTDPAKASKRGRLALRRGASGFETLRVENCPAEENLLAPVWRDGALLRRWRFAEIRETSEHACDPRK
ncbi:nicotinate phosphoribosyltransferase [Rhodoblastus sphagnicola]|uniref:Nicotinamide phosphoribosyltransferase n=1 Tax=Rhodoblastus sphagnicola TaxID=333368 RepID=A0A2S6NFC7_9HYPH|nr:nicotinate phosphoribosyltransferase [Rhodoblastus sphagnicola]MBB4200774.1 nicotinamide phosphoribosyltransferase [Rhodoblastus sphagnicola]PPQ33328.1 nicotinate phosphoribosyltransferase [Rhodoblastus sphagnicola]